MIKTFFTIFVMLFSSIFLKSKAQFSDNFNDGDFTNNPAWGGNTADFIVNPSFELQSNNIIASSTFYLSTASAKAISAQWEMDIKLPFSTSGSNYVDVYLTASLSDLTDNSNTGYLVRIGNTADEISLYRKDAGALPIKIIDGVDASLGSSNNLKLRVIRNNNNDWILERDLTGTGYFVEGSFNDATYTTSAYFGFLVKQSTSSFFQKHFFDNIVVGNYVPDVTPPVIQSVSALSAFAADVVFSEPVDQTTAETPGNYNINNGVGIPATAIRDITNTAIVHLTFNNAVPNGAVNTLTVANVKDLSNNAMPSSNFNFTFYIPQRFDLVIDEIMPDPNPVVALPNAEYVEIKNVSGKNINLAGWQLTSSTSSSGGLPPYNLPPDSFLILTTTTDAALFQSFGRVLALGSFPALGNSGTTLTLVSKEGLSVHSVSYDPTWYQNAVKSGGGWSLEMIDTKNPCAGASNWRASVDSRGGSPGIKNSIDGPNPDQVAPVLIRAAAIDSVTLLLTFSETIDSTKGATLSNYLINNGINNPVSATTLQPGFNKVQLTLSTALVRNTIYTITVNNISDCNGNAITANTARFGLPSPIDSFDIVINEVLFNPKPNSVDFVEIYNRSQKIVDLKNLYVTNRSTTSGTTGIPIQVTAENVLMFPGEYYVISESSATIKQDFVAKNPDNFVEISMPSYPDDKGAVVLMNSFGNIVDELRYDAKWHFGLLDNVEGISLERVDYNKPTQDAQNWHSAASTVGYGTPTYQNSQYRVDVAVSGDVQVTPKVFSPDNDGYEDFAVINYQIEDLGYVANITIFDAAGRPVKVLVRNATLGQKGFFRWDGLNDKNAKVPLGSYVIYTEMFNLEGKKKSFKNVVVVAGRF